MGQLPAVVLIHGGNWTGGDKSDMAGLVSHITSLNRICVNMNYRLAGTDNHVSCEVMQDDIGALIGYLKYHYNDCIKTTKIGLFGYSAGGHLALLYAYRSTSQIPVKLVISLAGPTDLLKTWQDYQASAPSSEDSPFKELSGDFPEGSPGFISALGEDYSPVHDAGANSSGKHTCLIYNTTDGLINYNDQFVPMDTSLLSAGASYSNCTVGNTGNPVLHGNLVSYSIQNQTLRSFWQSKIQSYD